MGKVSVVIPAYNVERYVGYAIESVLAQTYRDIEILVVDDGSTDGTREAIEPYCDRVSYIYQDNRGLAGARNTGVYRSTGEYLAFLDSDDRFLPTMLDHLTGALESSPRAGLAAGGFEYVDQSLNHIGYVYPWLLSPAVSMESVMWGGLTTTNAVVLRRSWFDRVGGFDETFRAAEDLDLWYRLCGAGCEMTWVRNVVSQYRIHTASMTRRIDEHFDFVFRALDKCFDSGAAPDSVRDNKRKLYANKRLGKAGRHYAVGDSESAKAEINRAIATDPSLPHRDRDFWLGWIMMWSRSPWVVDDRKLLSYVLSNLPESIDALRYSAGDILAQRAKAGFYQAWQLRSREVFRHWLAVAIREPGWLLNRGGLSIIFRSLLGHGQ